MRVRIPSNIHVIGTRTTKAPEFFRTLFADVLKTQNVMCFRLSPYGGWLCVSVDSSHIGGLSHFHDDLTGVTRTFDSNHDILLHQTRKVVYGTRDDLMNLP